MKVLPLIALLGISAAHAGQQYYATIGAGGIDVTNIWSAAGGEALVKGSPFIPTPAPQDYDGNHISPALLATDTTGTYLYALYGVPTGPETLWSFKLTAGVPHQINSSTGFLGECCESQPYSNALVVSAKHVWILTPSVYGNPATVTVFTTTNGTVKLINTLGLGTTYGNSILQPLALTVDPLEHFAYVTYEPAANYAQYGSCASDTCVAVYDIDGLPKAPVLIATLPAQAGVVAFGKSVN